MPFNVWVLTIAQALSMSAAPLMMLLGGLVGANLAPAPELATLPITAMVLGVAISILPVNRLISLFGRKVVFIAGSLIAALSGGVAAFAIEQDNFILFCGSGLLLGFAGAVIQQYRFAAMEAVDQSLAAKAASQVLVGGLVAAFLGPELAVLGSKFIATPFVGAFLLLSLVSFLSAICLLFYQQNVVVALTNNESYRGVTRPLSQLLSQFPLWVAIAGATIGFAMMSFVMTATPLHMHHIEHHSLADTKWVIQSHIIAMYAPSLVTGFLVTRWGVARMMFIGLVAYLITIIAALMGNELINYWVALVLLGLGWNLLFIGGTVLLPRCYREGEGLKVQAINDLFIFGFQAIASLSAGWVIHLLGWQQLLIICLPFIVLQFVLLACWKRSINKKRQVLSQ